jgi:hypothetical protein
MIKQDTKASRAEEVIDFEVIQWLKKHTAKSMGKALSGKKIDYFKSWFWQIDEKIDLKDQIEFAKKLFYSWDDDGSGVLEIDEISEPLIALGLAPDQKFVVQLIKSLDSKFLNIDDDDLSITLKDFLKIFRSDRLKKDFVLKPEKKISNSPNKSNHMISIF